MKNHDLFSKLRNKALNDPAPYNEFWMKFESIRIHSSGLEDHGVPGPMGPKRGRPQRRAQRKGTIFIDGYPSMNSSMVHQWIHWWISSSLRSSSLKSSSLRSSSLNSVLWNPVLWKNHEKTMKNHERHRTSTAGNYKNMKSPALRHVKRGLESVGPKRKAPKKGPKTGDHIHWWIPINGFIDGCPSMNSLMDIHQWIWSPFFGPFFWGLSFGTKPGKTTC